MMNLSETTRAAPETTPKSARVAVVRGERSVGTVLKALELGGGVGHLVGRPVLIKVNFIATKDWQSGATTDPVVVEGLIQALQPLNPNLYVVESDATTTNADRAAAATGILQLCQRYGVPFLNLRREKEKVKVKVKGGEVLSSVKLPKLVLESYVVSAAKMKTHHDAGVTLGLKNMFGLLPDKLKYKYHFRNINKVIVDINTAIRPALTVIDGFVAMEGKGPVNGTPVQMGVVVAGRDPVATDAVACRIMGFDPEEIYHIRRAAEKGFGVMDDVKVVGESIDNVMRNFKRS